MKTRLEFLILLLFFPALEASPHSPIRFSSRARRTSGGLHLPIYAAHRAARAEGSPESSISKRGEETGAIGLGDFIDVSYNVMVQVGSVETPVILDTGSADLWVMSSACSGNCSQSLPLYPISSFHPSGADVELLYGDSSTSTHAIGPIGSDTVNVAGLDLSAQYFAAVNNTNSTVASSGSTGIFGLGFPINSFIFSKLFEHEFPDAFQDGTSVDRRATLDDLLSDRSARFPTLPSKLSHLHSSSSPQNSKRQSSTAQPTTDDVLAAFSPFGPLLSRLVLSSDLAEPMFTVTLQRDTVDPGGNVGLLTIGELPDGVQNSSLTWVPVRGYTVAEGGLEPSSSDPNEVFPMAWEIPLDSVMLDGVTLPASQLSPDITLSALIDTGNTLLRGPPDVVSNVASKITSTSGTPDDAGSGVFSCATPHTLAFVIGGKPFPVDPRDFISQIYVGDLDHCEARLVSTDTPGVGKGFLYAWSLGDPFLRSNLVAFYYGNITHPSVDPPRIGFLSTVPSDAGQLLDEAVQDAKQSSDNFPEFSEAAPTGLPATSGIGIGGVAQAVPTGVAISPQTGTSGALRMAVLGGGIELAWWTVVGVVVCALGLVW